MGHLLIVAGTVIEWGGAEDQAIAAVLHDAIEDQPEKTPEAEIRRRFGDRVAEMVEGLSDADVIPKPPWLSRKQQYFERLEAESDDVVLISAADKPRPRQRTHCPHRFAPATFALSSSLGH